MYEPVISTHVAQETALGRDWGSSHLSVKFLLFTFPHELFILSSGATSTPDGQSLELATAEQRNLAKRV